MTKNIKLSKDYKLPVGMKFVGGHDFFDYTLPSSIVEGEGIKPSDIEKDPTNVPIYNQLMVDILDENNNVIGQEKDANWGDIIRYEGSVESPVECYHCHCGDDSIEVPTAKANEFLALKCHIPDPAFPSDLSKFLVKNIFEEVI